MDVFQIGIRVFLDDRITTGLGPIRTGLTGAHNAAQSLHSSLMRIQQMGAIGRDMFRESAAALHEVIEPAKELSKQISLMNQNGLTQVEIAKNVATAWKTTQQISNSSATENLKILADFRTILGFSPDKQAESRRLLTPFLKAQTVFESVTENPKVAGEQAFSALKFIESRGQVRSEKDIERNLSELAKAGTISQGRLLPSDFQQMAKYMRQMKMSANDQFMFGVMPEIMLEMKSKGGGASSAGTMVQAFGRMIVQGTMNKVTAGNLADLGLLKGGTLETTTNGTTAMKNAGISNRDIAAANPFEWVMKTLIPAMEAKYPEIKGNLQKTNLKIVELFKGNSLATNFIQELYNKAPQFQKFGEQRNSLGDLDKQYSGALGNPEVAQRAFAKSLVDLQTAIGEAAIPVIIPAMNALSKVFHESAIYFKDNPQMAQGIVSVIAGFGALGGALAAIALPATGVKVLMELGAGLGSVFGILAKVGGVIGAAFSYDGLAAVIGFGAAFARFIPVIGWVVTGVSALTFVIDHWNDIMKFAKDNVNYLRGAFAWLIETFPILGKALHDFQWVMKNWNNILAIGGGIWRTMTSAFHNFMQYVVDLVNKLPGVHIKLPQLPDMNAGKAASGKYADSVYKKYGIDDPLAFLDGKPASGQQPAGTKSPVIAKAQTKNITLHVHPGAIAVHQKEGQNAEVLAKIVLDQLVDQLKQSLLSTTQGMGTSMSPFAI